MVAKVKTKAPSKPVHGTLTVKAKDPINVTGTLRAKSPNRIPTCDVNDDSIGVGMSSPADETPSLMILEVSVEYVPNLKPASGALALVQRRLAALPNILREKITLVVSDTNDARSPELEDPKRGLLVKVPVSYDVADATYDDGEGAEDVPSNIALYARSAAGRFQESANDLIRVTNITVRTVETQELIYSL